jgi:hypothetical protein
VTELRAALKKLPAELVHEAGAIVRAQADATMTAAAAAYPVHTGNLRKGLSLELFGDSVSAVARVRNRAFHAYIFEEGTRPRRWAAGKSTGTMPAGHVFIPIAMLRRRIMTAALIELVERAGLTVTGIG